MQKLTLGNRFVGGFWSQVAEIKLKGSTDMGGPVARYTQRRKKLRWGPGYLTCDRAGQFRLTSWAQGGGELALFR